MAWIGLACAAGARAAVLDLDLSPPGTTPGVGLNPLNEVIPGFSSGSGNKMGSGITFNTTSLTLNLSIGYGSSAGFTDLTGPGFSWLLHGPAHSGETAPVLFDLGSFHTFAGDTARGGTIVGSLTYTPGQAADLLAGLDYINIYTPANLGGEIRGQLVPVPEPAAWPLAAVGGLMFAGRWLFRRRSGPKRPGC